MLSGRNSPTPSQKSDSQEQQSKFAHFKGVVNGEEITFNSTNLWLITRVNQLKVLLCQFTALTNHVPRAFSSQGRGGLLLQGPRKGATSRVRINRVITLTNRERPCHVGTWNQARLLPRLDLPSTICSPSKRSVQNHTLTMILPSCLWFRTCSEHPARLKNYCHSSKVIFCKSHFYFIPMGIMINLPHDISWWQHYSINIFKINPSL